jgi:hypothetical protein
MFCTASLGQEQNARTPPFSHRSRECTFESYHPLKIGSPIKGGHEELATERPAPLYPAAARRKGIGGRVSIQALIDRGGNVFRVCGYGDSRVLVNAGKHAVLKTEISEGFWSRPSRHSRTEGSMRSGKTLFRFQAIDVTGPRRTTESCC